MPKVSVILPAYNCARCLGESIESVLRQSLGDLELIVVDDGSTDGTAGVVERYRGDRRLFYLREEHAGRAAARNRGIDVSNGKYIAFIDSGDLFFPAKLSLEAELLDRHPRAAAAYGPERYFVDGDRTITYPSPYVHLAGDLLFFLKRSNFIHISTVMVRRASLGSLRFDLSLKNHEVWDFFLRIAAHGGTFVLVGREVALIRVHPDKADAGTPAMDPSYAIVGDRALAMWRDLKNERGVKGKTDSLAMQRYLFSKMRAWLIGFPGSERFNRPLEFRKMQK